ncbi:response regulator, partial [Candidatus Parcubacteria bacterium]|nr:response regulator [Candidatus Parcubacteria bacterium]
VEDDPVLQQTFTDFLKSEGYAIVSALDGLEGLKAAQSEEPHLILLDLILPKMDGFEVLQAIKADEKTKDIPVIVLTNLEGTGDVERALELGATTYLVKANYELEDILTKIKSVLPSNLGE